MSLMRVAENLTGKPEHKTTSVRIEKELVDYLDRIAEVWQMGRSGAVGGCIEILKGIIEDNGLKKECFAICALTGRLLKIQESERKKKQG